LGTVKNTMLVEMTIWAHKNNGKLW